MPRLKHRISGAVVSVSADKAKRIAADYEPVEAPKKAAPASKSTK